MLQFIDYIRHPRNKRPVGADLGVVDNSLDHSTIVFGDGEHGTKNGFMRTLYNVTNQEWEDFTHLNFIAWPQKYNDYTIAPNYVNARDGISSFLVTDWKKFWRGLIVTHGAYKVYNETCICPLLIDGKKHLFHAKAYRQSPIMLKGRVLIEGKYGEFSIVHNKALGTYVFGAWDYRDSKIKISLSKAPTREWGIARHIKFPIEDIPRLTYYEKYGEDGLRQIVHKYKEDIQAFRNTGGKRFNIISIFKKSGIEGLLDVANNTYIEHGNPYGFYMFIEEGQIYVTISLWGSYTTTLWKVLL